MKKLFEQIVKFGLVGVVAFVIDVGVMNLLLLAHVNNLLASTASFLISLVFNYWASMKYVFIHRSDMARWMEALIFLVSSVIGLGINELIIWMSTLGMAADAASMQHGAYALRTNVGKLVATVVVAIWNFIIRKWLLDATNIRTVGAQMDAGKVDGDEAAATPALSKAQTSAEEDTFSHRLGLWSLQHTPQGWK
ncbi:GtrA family protein [Bifidobacterium bombi]|uniref:GtrA-like protein n=1 Tax=Bifidobacterium bombi DSM 19703 TaxID=1341695 RepID=A0A080N6G7_9BIFI|nr:GtrA family protein [Bifidobacterium bombi]KFF31609.1 GtrA-like protein [Bifidobacterium bombi DSM 19703]